MHCPHCLNRVQSVVVIDGVCACDDCHDSRNDLDLLEPVGPDVRLSMKWLLEGYQCQPPSERESVRATSVGCYESTASRPTK